MERHSSSRYSATDGQSASSSWCQAPHLSPTTRFLLLSDICGLHIVEHPPWREDGSVIYLYNSLSLSGSSPTELMTTFYCLIWYSPNLVGPGPHMYIPQEQGGPVIPPGPMFPFVASYDSQGYSGGILTRLYTGQTYPRPISLQSQWKALLLPG
jgi:hypothetical protein